MAECGWPSLRCEVLAGAPGECRLRVAGEVDLATAPQLAGFLSAQIARAAPGARVALDLARVGFFSAAGVRVLLDAVELAGCRGVALVVEPVSSSAALVIALCGIADAVGPG
jgi:anti-anti-sigma factor